MPEFDVLSFGETMAMLVADQRGDLANVEQFHKRVAGADSNVAIGLSRLGFKVAWLSRVGADSLGRFVVQTLENEGLDCRHVTVDPAHPTGFQFKSRSDDGSDPQVEYFRRGSAASHLSIDTIAPSQLEARHLHATGIVPALSVTAREMSSELMMRMREAGRSLSFDPNLRPSLWASESMMIHEINRLAALAHWVMPGLGEGRLLTGFDDPADIAAFYLDLGAEIVVIKLGADGAYFRTQLGQGVVAGVPVAQVVDTVGAGDGFAVGLISALLEGRAITEAVQRANWIGSRAVQSRGDMEGLPTRIELLAEFNDANRQQARSHRVDASSCGSEPARD
ncbi:2-dehydro-3-deoxygluconokinase [Pseudomonas sp. E141]|jgi:sugar/nucleoside kinase (ribokinase family)|uniref:Sugar kinase n=1 Tax=Pseudomonas rhizophila TaxID=2045200 RepID=A0ABM6UGN6_9PSED|nr:MULTISPECIES: sugar kinase [Pseudomonas]AVU76687.1 sugar kinase [Pseudomonas rhizophila]MDD2030378.1 sugar kinase [Pseudomonas sp. 39167]MDR8384313.1 sugar kinase [Pseudomonas sp. JL2]SIR98520.1 dehydrogluconokinase [Pseudomonas sp. A214]